MEVVGSIFAWIGESEAVLSGIAATIVILGVLYAPLRRLLGRSHVSDPAAPPSPPPAEIAHELHADSPSIAVMPFANLSAEAEQEFLADDFAQMAGALAPDPEWREVVRQALLRAAEAADQANHA